MDSNQIIISRTDTMCYTELNNEVVILNSTDDSLYQLNHSASELWRALEAPKTLMELTEVLAEVYDHQNFDYQQDVLKWVMDNQEKGLLSIIPKINTQESMTIEA